MHRVLAEVSRVLRPGGLLHLHHLRPAPLPQAPLRPGGLWLVPAPRHLRGWGRRRLPLLPLRHAQGAAPGPHRPGPGATAAPAPPRPPAPPPPPAPPDDDEDYLLAIQL
ncbi:unnamed protein product [Bubo scandiacus]